MWALYRFDVWSIGTVGQVRVGIELLERLEDEPRSVVARKDPEDPRAFGWGQVEEALASLIEETRAVRSTVAGIMNGKPPKVNRYEGRPKAQLEEKTVRKAKSVEDAFRMLGLPTS